MHPNKHRNGHQLSTKWALCSDQSSVRSWPAQLGRGRGLVQAMT